MRGSSPVWHSPSLKCFISPTIAFPFPDVYTGAKADNIVLWRKKLWPCQSKGRNYLKAVLPLWTLRGGCVEIVSLGGCMATHTLVWQWGLPKYRKFWPILHSSLSCQAAASWTLGRLRIFCEKDRCTQKGEQFQIHIKFNQDIEHRIVKYRGRFNQKQKLH